MMFLSYSVGQDTLTSMLFLFIIPVAMLLFSVFTAKRMKRKADEHFAYEDNRMEEFRRDKEIEDDFSYWSKKSAP